jgi:folate-binding protein YgfZ
MSIEPVLSPVHPHHELREAFFLPYGTEHCVSQVVETFGDLDMEYAALRKGCVIFDETHMGTLIITGSERLEFLNNMLTAKVIDLQAGQLCNSFWLNRKGRIDADLRISEFGDRIVARLDRHLASSTLESLDAFIIADDSEIENASDKLHRFSIHGPTAPLLIGALISQELDLGDSQCVAASWHGNYVWIERDDICGEVGISIIVDREQAAGLYEAMLTICEQNSELKARPSGWMALNAARIEAGKPMYNLDFGATNLPVESGLIDERVNFTKGCYLGQEVVARMHARGAMPRTVVGVRVDDQRITQDQTEIRQPTTGSQVFEPGKESETPIGVVTSSTISPMLGAIPVCFVMIKSGYENAGTKLSISAEGGLVLGTVQEKLAFWSKVAAN